MLNHGRHHRGSVLLEEDNEVGLGTVRLVWRAAYAKHSHGGGHAGTNAYNGSCSVYAPCEDVV